MTDEQIREAVEQVKCHCDLLMNGYRPVSLRDALRDLGFHGEDRDEVIYWVAERGFEYCLDPLIACKGPDGYESPNYEVCFWGPDQLKSRLDCLESRPRTPIVRGEHRLTLPRTILV